MVDPAKTIGNGENQELSDVVIIEGTFLYMGECFYVS